MHAWIGHAVGTGLLGFMLPSGEHLEWLYRLVKPVVELIPNAVRLSNRSPNPILAQTFIGLSLLIALLILLYFAFFVRGYHQKTFPNHWQRLSMFILVTPFVLMVLHAGWFLSYVNPAAKGRTYYLLKGAAAGDMGIFIVMNQLIVGIPLLFLLAFWSCHACTSVRGSAKSI